MKFEERQTGTFTGKATIGYVTTEHGKEIVGVHFHGAVQPVNFYASGLEGKFEPDEPEFVHGGIYRTKTGSLWLYVDPDVNGGKGSPYFITFGTSSQYSARNPLFEDAELIS